MDGQRMTWLRAPYTTRLDETRARVLYVMAEDGGWLTRREIEAAAYHPREWRDLAVASAVGWARDRGLIDTSDQSGRYRINDKGRRFLLRDELGCVLMMGDEK